MSLKVWLPLDGDLRNLGTSNIEVTNNGATVNNAGKIGKCYNFDGQSHYLTIPNLPMTKTMSFALWYKPSITTSSIPNGYHHIFDGRLNESGQEVLCLESPSFKAWGVRTSEILNQDTWYHICVINNNGQVTIYINGHVSVTGTTSMTSEYITTLYIGARHTGTNTLAEKMNDIRIYDHCLSTAEVRKISQGLILHYKLDDITNGVIDSSGYGHNGSTVSPLPLITDSPRYNSAFTFEGNVAHRIYYNDNDLNFTDNFSYAFWCKANYSGTWEYLFTVGRVDMGGYGYGIRNNNDTSLLFYFGNATYNMTITKNEWTHIAFIKSGTTIKIYKNGNLYSNNTFSGTLPTYSDGNGLGIGCFHYSGDIYPGYGSMSDFRIYCTTLSADDVKQLYNVGAKVDNLSNIHTFELKEITGTETASIESSSIVSINDASAAPINDITIAINPVQDLHGYDHPWPAGGGKNLFNGPLNKVLLGNVTEGFSVVDGGTSFIAHVEKNTTYTVKDHSASYGNRFRIVGFVSEPSSTLTMEAYQFILNNNISPREYTFNSEDYEYIVFTCNSTDFDQTCKAQIEIGSTATSYAPYSNICPISGWTGANVIVSPTQDAQDGTTYSMSWQTQAGTVYGGTLDVTTGLLTVDRAKITVTESTSGYSINGHYIATNLFSGAKDYANNVFPDGALCNVAPAKKFVDIYPGVSGFTTLHGAGALAITGIATREEFNTYASNNTIQVVYPLATPQTYQLTPTEVALLVGDNNIWADTGETSVTYYKNASTNLLKIGIFQSDQFIENTKAALYKCGITKSINFIEI